MTPLKVLDCFSGIGGFALAESFFKGQFETKQFVEIDPYCQKVLSKNFKDVPIHDDIKTFTAPRGSFDITTFGFPCQDISVAGRQSGMGKETRSGLFYECIRLLREIRPKFAIFENVRNLLSIEEGRVFQEVLFQIAQAGYDAEWGVVSAKDVGGCHLRQRIWIIAYPSSVIKNRTESSIQAGRNTAASSTSTNSKSISSDDRKVGDNQRERQEQLQIGGVNSTELTDSNDKRLQRQWGKYELQESSREEKARWRTQPYTLQPDWRRYLSKPTVRRGDDGLSNRVDRLKCLGNAVTPQQAAIPLGRILDLRSL
tara:strand:+ start:1073 stop:2011 length:939 start_codon:yes stop_codon:yes gene_type:complete